MSSGQVAATRDLSPRPNKLPGERLVARPYPCSGDVFGFFSKEDTFTNWQYLLVYPLVVPLTRFSLPARHPFGDRRAPRRLLEDPARVIGVRDYAYGDSLRCVHWKATARTMQLQ